MRFLATDFVLSIVFRTIFFGPRFRFGEPFSPPPTFCWFPKFDLVESSALISSRSLPPSLPNDEEVVFTFSLLTADENARCNLFLIAERSEQKELSKAFKLGDFGRGFSLRRLQKRSDITPDLNVPRINLSS